MYVFPCLPKVPTFTNRTSTLSLIITYLLVVLPMTAACRHPAAPRSLHRSTLFPPWQLCLDFEQNPPS